MVHRTADTRLLTNLLSHESNYTSSLYSLFSLSTASITSLQAYAASVPPPTPSTTGISSTLILQLAELLGQVDDALRLYVRGIEEWVRLIGELKECEEEVGRVGRDREILVTRLLKASSKSSSSNTGNRDSVLSSSSNLSLETSKSYAPSSSKFFPKSSSKSTSASKKLLSAQTELQACEAHLALKEAELQHKREEAVKEGLLKRFVALKECANLWIGVGREGEVLLGAGMQTDTSTLKTISNKPLPSLHAPIPVHAGANPISMAVTDLEHEQQQGGSDLSSIAPSQSASQTGDLGALGLNLSSSPPPMSPRTHISHIYAQIDAMDQARSSNSSTPVTHETHESLTIPPAHSIDDLTLPVTSTPIVSPQLSSAFPSVAPGESSGPKRHVLPHRITEEDLGVGYNRGAESDDDHSDSDEEEHNHATVVENARFAGRSSTSPKKSPTKGKGRSATSDSTGSSRQGSTGFFGSLKGLFTRPSRRKAVARDLFSDGEDDNDGNGSVASSPPALLFSSSGSQPQNKSTPPRVPPIRGRTMSSSTPSTAATSGRGVLKKSGTGVGLRGRPETESAEEVQEKRRRRRSASLDYGDLSVNSRKRAAAKADRAERFRRGSEEAVELESPPKRPPKSDKRRSLPVTSSSTSSLPIHVASSSYIPPLPSSSSSPLTTALLSVPGPSAPSGHGKTVSRNSSLSVRSAPPSAPPAVPSIPISGSGVNVGRRNSTSSHGNGHRRAGSVDNHSPPSNAQSVTTTHPSSSSSSLTITSSSSGTAKAQRRASSPPTSSSNGAGPNASTSLMSIVEDLSKANREAWSKQKDEREGAPMSAPMVTVRSVGGTVKPIGLMDPLPNGSAVNTGGHALDVKAPKSIDMEDLKESVGKELAERENAGTRVGRSSSRSGRSRSKDRSRSRSRSRSRGPRHRQSELEALPVVTAPPEPTSSPAKPPVHLPLRSALKNGSATSRTPSPQVPPISSSRANTTSNQHPERTQSPLVVPPSGVTVSLPNGDAKGKQKAFENEDSDSSDSDAASISSYETGHEVFSDFDNKGEGDGRLGNGVDFGYGYKGVAEEDEDEEENSDTETEIGSHSHHMHGSLLPSPPPPVSQSPPPPSGISSVSNSTVTPVHPQSNGDAAEYPAIESTPPRRRKSVRVSLQPTFSATPPAIEYEFSYDEDENDDNDDDSTEADVDARSDEQDDGRDSENFHHDHNSGTTKQSLQPDLWADSSDEDTEYKRARRLLIRSSGNGGKGKGNTKRR